MAGRACRVGWRASRELTVELEGDVMTLKNSGAPAAAPGDGHFRPPPPARVSGMEARAEAEVRLGQAGHGEESAAGGRVSIPPPPVLGDGAPSARDPR